MSRVAQLKLNYFNPGVRGSAGELALMVLEGAMEGTRLNGAPRKQWLDNIQEWSGNRNTRCWHKIRTV